MNKTISHFTIFIFIILSHAISNEGIAQDNPCKETGIRNSYLIPEAYKHQKIDSIAFLLNEWAQECGPGNELVFRLQVLLKLKEGIDPEFYSHPEVLSFIRIYRYRELLVGERKANEVFEKFQESMGYVFPGSDFDLFTREMANEILRTYPKSDSINRDVLLFYAGESQYLISKLKENRYYPTYLQDDYNQAVKRLKSLSELQLSVFSGAWVPMGNASVLGVHPILGAELGLRKNKFQAAMVGEFRFGNAPNTINIYQSDTILETDRFSGHYLGLEGSRMFFENDRGYYMLSMGVGIDGFDAVKKTQGFESKTINSLNLNIGAGYAIKISKKLSASLQVRYHFINYNNKGGTAVDGHALSIRLAMGFRENARKNEGLKQLGY